MTQYSVQPRHISENISKNLSSKYSQKPIDHAKQSATDALKTASKRAIQKTTEATGYLIGNKIADRITKVSKTSPQKIQLQMKKKVLDLIEKYMEKYIYLQNKDRKFLMI